MATDIDRLLEEIRALGAVEQQRVREALDEGTAPSAQRSAEEEFKRRLLRAGLLKEIKPPLTDLTPYRDRKPFEIQGPPVSETIIGERR